MKRRTALIAFAAAYSSSGWSIASAQDMSSQKNDAPSVGQVLTPAPIPGDPWEPANRRLFIFSDVLDKYLFRPVAMTYRRVLPRFVRSAAHNVVSNLNEPGIVINDILQGKIKRAGTSSARFAANTTLGVAGIFDVAKRAGLEHHDNDFGITLGKWNLEAGPYLFVPLAGPSSVRDLTGTAVDFVVDPIGWIDFRDSDIFYATQFTISALDARVRAEPILQQLHVAAVDPYATMRSVYLQSRESQVHDGAVDMDALPDFPEEGTASETLTAPPSEEAPVPNGQAEPALKPAF